MMILTDSLTPDQSQQFKTSKVCLTAVKLIGLMSTEDHSMLQTEYVTVRNLLIATIAFTNANRSGVLANMTLEEFNKDRVVDGHYVVSVSDHKTAASYGLAKIILPTSLYSWMIIYAKRIRPHIASKVIPELFITWRGDSLTSGQVTRCVQSMWKKAELWDDVTFNVIRKTIHSVRPEITAPLADLMCHRVSTAQKCCQLSEREKNVCSSLKTARTGIAKQY